MKGGITPELLLRAYGSGIFPMAESRADPVLYWIDPERRGILPLDGFHISRSLRRRILHEPFRVSINENFAGVMEGCADRPETWINATIFDLACALHRAGHAHSLEVWEGGTLVGGIYGVTLGGAFFGESMFSHRPDASKIALAYLVDRLRIGGFTLFDTQFVTGHLKRLGAVEVSRSEYRRLLADALRQPADYTRQCGTPRPQEVVQRSSQMS